jgi:hypothetical protein
MRKSTEQEFMLNATRHLSRPFRSRAASLDAILAPTIDAAANDGVGGNAGGSIL